LIDGSILGLDILEEMLEHSASPTKENISNTDRSTRTRRGKGV